MAKNWYADKAMSYARVIGENLNHLAQACKKTKASAMDDTVSTFALYMVMRQGEKQPRYTTLLRSNTTESDNFAAALMCMKHSSDEIKINLGRAMFIDAGISPMFVDSLIQTTQQQDGNKEKSSEEVSTPQSATEEDLKKGSPTTETKSNASKKSDDNVGDRE